MDITPMYIAGGLSAMLIVLGFIALLSQKIYLDSKTLKPVTVEISFLGKMTANYPSLVFVFLGAALGVYGIQHTSTKLVPWKISATLKPDGKVPNWQTARVAVHPLDTGAQIGYDNGRFSFELLIPDGKTFETFVDLVTIDAPFGGGTLYPKAQMEQYQKDRSGMLQGSSDTSREYVIPFAVFAQTAETSEESNP